MSDVIDVVSKEKVVQASKDDFPDLPTDAKRPLRIGLWVLLIGFGGFLLWAALAPLGEGVPAQASVAIDNRRKTVQHLTGGVVKRILVKEGQSVKEGEILILMDDSVPLANKSSAEAELKAVDAQVVFLEKILTDIRPMIDEGYFPRNRFNEYEKQLAEAKARQSGLRDRVAATKLELSRAVVLAPSSGRVMGLALTTEGGVINPGGRLLDLVPDNERLVVEAQIQPHLIDKVVPGLEVEVRFSAFNLRSTPITVGVVEWVSADRFQTQQDPMNPAGFYLARLVVSAEEIKKIGDVSLRPGMPAEVVFKTGQRTFFQYLIKPLTDRMATSLREI